MSTPRLITLTAEALTTCNYWQVLRNQAELSNELFVSTQAMLRSLSTQEDQTAIATITGVREELAEALAGETAALATIIDLRTQLAARDATIATLNRMANITPAQTN